MDNYATLQPIVNDHAVHGFLRLHFSYDQANQQTRLISCEQQPPLKVIRAFPLPAGAALVHVHNISGGVLGGDQLEIAVDVEPQASVQLTSTSATRIYRSRAAAPIASQTYAVHIQAGALLEYLPDPLIPFAGSRYQQKIQIDLDADAGLFWWETLTPGRTARGEVFAYDELHSAIEIYAEGKPIAIERYRLAPQQQRLSSPLRLGPYAYTCSFYICRVGLEAGRWLALERTLSELAQKLSRAGECIWAVSTLVAHGLVVRALSSQGRDITAGLLAFWRAAKLALYEQEAIPPRKIY